MKKLLLIAFIILINKGYSQCPTDVVVLASQSDVDLFATNYPSCTVLDFNLSIGTTDNSPSDITDLSPLSNLTSVGGFLYVHDNPNLADFSGLETLSNVTTGMYIDNNSGLLNLNGLSGLTTVGYVNVLNNANISTFSALSNLSTISGYFSIFNNSSLIDFTGLNSITTIPAEFYVGSNSSLTSFSGFNSLTTLGNYFWIEFNNSLIDFSGLNNLDNISGFAYTGDHALLENFGGLNSLTTIGGYFYAINNTGLTSFTGLNNVTTIGTSFTIQNNDALLNLTGFDSLASVGTSLDIRENAVMTSLDGLESLTSIGSFLAIRFDMPSLVSISGISNIDYTTITEFRINNVANLMVCEESNVCEYLDNGGAANISGNATGCNTIVEIVAQCATLSNSDFLLEDSLNIFPNPTNDILNIHVLNSINIENIEIFSLQGRLIKTGGLSNDALNINELASGMYLLKVTTDKGVVTEKIIKE